MTFLATAFKELKKHFIMNIITIFELTVSIVMVCVMVSAVLIRYKYYEPFADFYNSNGIYCDFTGTGVGACLEGPSSTGTRTYICDDEIFPYLNSPKSMISSNYVPAYPVYNKENITCPCYSYNDELINRYTPGLSSGKWFDTTKKSEMIEAVISENEYGWKTGDVISVFFHCKDFNSVLDVKIIGELDSTTKVPGISVNHEVESNSNMFFTNYDYDEEGEPLFIFSSSQLKENEVIQGLRVAMITYSSDPSEEELLDDRKTISSFGSMFYTELSAINEKSKDYFLLQIFNYLPLILVVLVLTFVSSISITAVSTRQRLHDYGIYYICGLKWRSCSTVNLCYSIIIAAISFIISVVLMVFSSNFALTSKLTVIWNTWTWLAIIVVILLFIMGSMIMPLIIIGNNTPKEILTKGDA